MSILDSLKRMFLDSGKNYVAPNETTPKPNGNSPSRTIAKLLNFLCMTFCVALVLVFVVGIPIHMMQMKVIDTFCLEVYQSTDTKSPEQTAEPNLAKPYAIYLFPCHDRQRGELRFGYYVSDAGTEFAGGMRHYIGTLPKEERDEIEAGICRNKLMLKSVVAVVPFEEDSKSGVYESVVQWKHMFGSKYQGPVRTERRLKEFNHTYFGIRVFVLAVDSHKVVGYKEIHCLTPEGSPRDVLPLMCAWLTGRNSIYSNGVWEPVKYW